MYQRNIEPRILEALADTPAVFLNGARQTGKSTVATALCGPSGPLEAYLTFDDAAVLAAACADPAGFLAGLPDRVALDEVQRAPGLFPVLKAAIDRDRRPGRFLLTGSADVMLLPGIAEYLAGRMEVLTLWPLSQGEIREVREDFVSALFRVAPFLPRATPGSAGATRKEIVAAIVRGGYPEAISRSTERRRSAWFGSYVTTVLQRDVRDLADVSGLTALPHLLRLLAARSGTLFNQAEISRASALPYTTLRRYLSLLETTFLVGVTPPWNPNLGKRLVKSPRVVMHDTGLASSLLGLDEPRLLHEPLLLGPLLETFVAGEIRRQLGWSDTRAELRHFRTQEGTEVDLVVETPDGRIAGIEIKAAGSVGANDFRGLRYLERAVGSRFAQGVVLYLGESAVAFGERLAAVPVSALWKPAAAE